MTTVINLLAGPGAGKSTLAAELYAAMKKQHMKVEMVREVAKEWAWEGRAIGPFEQISILGEQIKRESSLFNKVDYIVTDSPVLLGAFYFDWNHNQSFVNQMVRDYYRFAENNGVKFLNFILPRTKQYVQDGRYETQAEALDIDNGIDFYTIMNNYNCETFSDNISYEDLLNHILKAVNCVKS